MKLGKYTSVFTLDNNYTLFYNALTDRYVAAKGHFANSTLFNLENGQLLKDLTEIGAIINDDSNEEEVLLKRTAKILNNEQSFRIIINPTLACNFRCWYCYEAHENKPLMKYELVLSIKRLISKTIEENQKLRVFSLSFFGGEPILGFDTIIKPLMEFTETTCRDNGIEPEFSFTTNGYLITDEMVAYFNNKDVSFQITLDGGKEQHNKVSYPIKLGESYDRILSNIHKLAINKLQVTLRVNYTQETAQSIKGIIDDLSKWEDIVRHYIAIDFQRVWQDRDKNKHTDIVEVPDAIKRLQKLGFRTTRPEWQNNAMNPCYADYRNQLLVNYNGDVFKCTAREFTRESRLGVLKQDGTVIWDEEAMRKRDAAKMSKKICRECRIAPVCGSGCKQSNIENANHDGCNRGFTEKDIDDWILKRFEYLFMNKGIPS